MKNRNKAISIMVICLLMVGVVVYGATQYSYATLNSTSLYVEGNNINGGTGTLSGALQSSGGSVQVSAYKVIALWPDEQVAAFTTSSTTTRTLSGIELDAYENLFYVRIDRLSGAPSAWGQLASVN